MDLFEAFPQLSTVFQGRALRLIALSAIVYDDQAFYFESGDARLWGRLPTGEVSIGIGAAKTSPDAHNSPSKLLSRHLRKHWACEVGLFDTRHTYILDETQRQLPPPITTLDNMTPEMPYLLILTPPRLGGSSDVPDALAQAVYLMPLRRWRGKSNTRLLRIHREALGNFLANADWDLSALQAQPWAQFLPGTALLDVAPEAARLRPVLALRGLQHLLKMDAFPIHLNPSTIN